MQYGIFIIYLKFNKVFQLTIQEYYDFIYTFKTFKLIRTINYDIIKVRYSKKRVLKYYTAEQHFTTRSITIYSRYSPCEPFSPEIY